MAAGVAEAANNAKQEAPQPVGTVPARSPVVRAQYAVGGVDNMGGKLGAYRPQSGPLQTCVTIAATGIRRPVPT
jgi:hypothetical protein